MTSKNDWQSRVGETWAAEWQRTDRSFGNLTDQLLGRAGEHPFSRALDIGCGAGEISLALARNHTDSHITGIDVSSALVTAAQNRASRLGNVSFEVADASDWRREDFAPDLLVSRHGVMFFADPVSSFAHLRAIAPPRALLLFSCFRGRQENPWATRIAKLLPPGAAVPGDRFAPGPFAFAEPAHVERILREAGWADIQFEPVDYAYIAGSGPDPVDDAESFFLRIGPAAGPAAGLDKAQRAQFSARLRHFLASNLTDGIIALRASAWVVTARHPG